MPIELTTDGRERKTALGFVSAALLGCLIGGVWRPSGGLHQGAGLQVVGLVRIATTLALAVVVVLGPGLALRARRGGVWGLGFVVLPGLGLLAATGLVAWLAGLAGAPHATVVSAVIIGPTLVWLLYESLRVRERALTTSDERRALVIVGFALGAALARASWSLGPVGELFGGTVDRTLEVGDRSDPTIGYHVVQLVVQGASPAGALSRSYFAPYTFSARGPLAGIATVPIVLLGGGRPLSAVGTQAWVPFDPTGVVAYRLAMMVFSATCLPALWTLADRIGGRRAAYVTILVAATTPFIVHEIWFIWPKMLAGTLVLLAAICLLERRPLRAGLLVTIGYLVHPIALFSLPALALIALWPMHGAQPLRPHARSLLCLVAATALGVIAWRLINLHDYTQSGFTSYLTEAGRTRGYFSGHPDVTISSWISDRLISLSNTVVPLRLFFLSAQNQSVNTAYQACFPLCNGGSPPIVHFYFQYWTSLPFAMGIFFFPLMLTGLWRALPRWPWAVTATILIPFVAFWIYWGDASTGLMREGLQIWTLVLVLVLVLDQSSRGFPWLRSPFVRAILCFRVVELVLDEILPTIWTTHRVVSSVFTVNDVASLAVLAFCGGALTRAVWRAGEGTWGEAPGGLDVANV